MIRPWWNDSTNPSFESKKSLKRALMIEAIPSIPIIIKIIIKLTGKLERY
jgi:hypothetical protein